MESYPDLQSFELVTSSLGFGVIYKLFRQFMGLVDQALSLLLRQMSQ